MQAIDRTAELKRTRERLMEGGGKSRLEKQRASGKLTARERVDHLVDPESFQEVGLFATHQATLFGMAGKELPADGVVTGAATIDGRLVHLASQDFTVAGGSAGETHSDKVAEMMKYSLKTGSPFVFINDSGGARVQEGVGSLAGYGRVFYNNVMLSGVVPQISLICGPCAGGAAYSPALTDFIIQTKAAQMFITGPTVIKQVTGEVVTSEQLGGPTAQMNYSGVVHFVAEDDDDAIFTCKRLLSFLPSNNLEDPPRAAFDEQAQDDDKLADIVPEDPKKGYDMREVIARLVDHADFLEVQATFAENVIIGFGRLIGRTVGIIANQPAVLAGALDINASDKCCPLYPVLQCVQHSPGHARGRAGLPARSAAGVWRNHTPRGETVVCLLRGDSSQVNRDHSKSVRRCVPGYVRQGSGGGPGGGLAYGRDRRHGRGGRGRGGLPQRAQPGRGQKGAPRRVDRSLSQGVLEPAGSRRPASGGRHHRSGPDAPVSRNGARGAARETGAEAAQEARPHAAVAWADRPVPKEALWN